MLRLLSILLLATNLTIQESNTTVKKRRELINFVPNTLTQARFYQLRRMPLKRWNNDSRGQKMREGPLLICGQGSIGLSVPQRMTGRIYASRMGHVSQCIQYITKDVPARFTTQLDGPCGVKTFKQTAYIEYRLRVVVSFSHDQLTEDDVIYDVTCRYDESNVSVDAHYDTRGFIPQKISNRTSVPQCSYSLHKDDVMGETTNNARVGQLVYHRWSCPSDDFAFKVYRCFVHNGMTKSYMIVDDNGCSLDEEIIPHPTYDMDKQMVFTPAKAFRFSKSRRVHFNCLLAVCHKWDENCMRSIPPRCPHSQKKRHLPGNISIEERLLRVHALLNGLPSSDRDGEGLLNSPDTISLSTDDLSIDDDPAVLTRPSCSWYQYSHWFFLLFFTNILSLSFALFTCCQLMRNRYTVDMYKMRKSMGTHFKF